MIQTLKKISLVESFLCPDKQGTPEKGRRIQQPKHCEKNNKDENNSPKTLTDRNTYLHHPGMNKFASFFLFFYLLLIIEQLK